MKPIDSMTLDEIRAELAEHQKRPLGEQTKISAARMRELISAARGITKGARRPAKQPKAKP